MDAVFPMIEPAVSEETKELFRLTTDVVPNYVSSSVVFHFGQQYLLHKHNGRCAVQTEIMILFDASNKQII